MKIHREQLRVGQVLDEDEDWMTLKVAKSDLASYHLEGGERFVTLLFVQPDGRGGMKADFPWKDGS